MGDFDVQNVDGGAVFHVKVVPASSQTKIAGLLDGMVKIRVSSPPEKGKANQRVIDLLSKQLGVKKGDVTIISGRTRAVKQVRVSGLSAANLADKLALDM